MIHRWPQLAVLGLPRSQSKAMLILQLLPLLHPAIAMVSRGPWPPYSGVNGGVLGRSRRSRTTSLGPSRAASLLGPDANSHPQAEQQDACEDQDQPRILPPQRRRPLQPVSGGRVSSIMWKCLIIRLHADIPRW